MLTFSVHFNYSNYCITWPWLCPALSACCPVKSELFATRGSLIQWFQALGPAYDGLWEARLPSLLSQLLGRWLADSSLPLGTPAAASHLPKVMAPWGSPSPVPDAWGWGWSKAITLRHQKSQPWARLQVALSWHRSSAPPSLPRCWPPGPS